MGEEIDIYRTAQIHIEQYGDMDLHDAIRRIEKYHSISNESAMAVWNKIANAIKWGRMPADLGDTVCH